MCGIVGILDYVQPIDLGRLVRMARSLAHRGPDGEAYWFHDGIGLGHRRLSIVDVVGGRQPAVSEDEKIRVIFNGELYNHREVRRSLELRGHRMRSNSDAEVLPHLFEEFDDRFVDELDGDFAIALWDSRTGRLVLARDRVGVKPLFLRETSAVVAFASEIKALVAGGYCDGSVDPQGLRDFLYYGQPCAPGTFWRGVTELPPGHVATFHPDGRALRRRYFIPLARGDSPPIQDEAEAVALFHHTFVEAVRKRTRAEVPIGGTLSGGIDSSLTVAVAARIGVRLPTWTIRLPGTSLDEGRYSRLVARSLGVENEEVEVGAADSCALLSDTLWHLEIPQWFGLTPAFMKLTGAARRRGVKVAITGDGADELLAGYPFYRLLGLERALAWCDRYGLCGLRSWLYRRIFSWLDVPQGAVTHFAAAPARAAAEQARFGGGHPAWHYVWSAMEDMTSGVTYPQQIADRPTNLPSPPRQTDPLRRALHYEYFTRLSGWVLLLSDRLSMAHGVEVRVPFMDRALLDLVPRMPACMFLRGPHEKYVLKQAFGDLLPREVVRRRKKPFFTPIASWYLRGHGAELVAEYLGTAAVNRSGLFLPASVRALLAEANGSCGTWKGTVAEWACMAVMTTHMLQERFHAAASDAAHGRASDPTLVESVGTFNAFENGPTSGRQSESTAG